MKIYYFNDTIKEQTVFTETFHGPGVKLLPQTGKVFEVDMPEGYIPFIKVWATSIVLISRCQENIDQTSYGAKND